MTPESYEAIRERLRAGTTGGDVDLHLFYETAPTDIAALLAECDRLRAEIGNEREACIKTIQALPQAGLYRCGGGYHAPSYDDAWRLAVTSIRAKAYGNAAPTL
jgi:hypothetical protein